MTPAHWLLFYVRIWKSYKKLSQLMPRTLTPSQTNRIQYTALARGACRNAVKDIRSWKVQGKLATWAAEDAAIV
jgi:hypothetical protein